jgi:hypothetical protein
MAPLPITEKELRRAVAMFKKHRTHQAVANAIGISRAGVQHRLIEAVRRGVASPSDIVSKNSSTSHVNAKKGAKRDKVTNLEPDDPVALRRAINENARIRAELRDMTERAVNEQTLRSEVFGLRDMPDAPISFPSPSGKRGNKAETIVVTLSDLHWGEVVDLDAMDGINSYNLKIARQRLKRAFLGVIALATEHWAGPPPARVIVILGGDMISGEIHNELERTNEATSLPALKDCADHIAAGLDLLAKSLPKTPIEVIVIPGNHGRSTLKYQSKGYTLTSYDTLCGDLIEMRLHDRKQFSFYRPASGDALFNVYNWLVLASHGDRLGSRGGMGFVGVAATAARGFKKVIMDYSARGFRVDLIIIGHFHSALELEEGFVNSSLVGPSEYSRDGRFRPRPATQLFLAIHPDRGVTQTRRLQVGSPEEGSLYSTPSLQKLAA